MTQDEKEALRKSLYKLLEQVESGDYAPISIHYSALGACLQLQSYCEELEERIRILESKGRSMSDSISNLGKRTEGLQVYGGQFDARLLPGSDDRYK